METRNLDEQGFKRAENEHYKVILFPIINKSSNLSSQAELVYNAKVTVKALKFVLSFPIRQLMDGTLIAGSNSKMNGYRAIVDEFKGGQSYEKVSIPKEVYNDIMKLIEQA